jgi:hypothetical protein
MADDLLEGLIVKAPVFVHERRQHDRGQGADCGFFLGRVLDYLCAEIRLGDGAFMAVIASACNEE